MQFQNEILKSCESQAENNRHHNNKQNLLDIEKKASKKISEEMKKLYFSTGKAFETDSEHYLLA